MTSITSVGYNRWPRQWPGRVPLWARWPVVMDGVASWPFQWRVQFVGSNLARPPNFPRRAFAEYHASTPTQTIWAVLPTLPGGLTLTFLTATLTGTIAEPTGIDWSLSVIQQVGNPWQSTVTRIPYELPLTGNQTPQNRRTRVSLFQDSPELRWFVDYEIFTTFCGETWELG